MTSTICKHPKDKWIDTTKGERWFYAYEIYDDSEPIVICGVCYAEVPMKKTKPVIYDKEF